MTPWPTLYQMLAMTDAELSAVDPVAMNLIVASGLPALADLDIGHYVRLADAWADDLRRRMPALEAEFHKAPQDWRHDLAFFRLGLVCWYMDIVLGIAYKEDHRNLTRVRYTDPSDLFLNGIMDTGRGTCGNMSMLNVALGRRIGLPVSLACVGSHYMCRYDDGIIIHNIETTNTGNGGFASASDEEVMAKRNLPQLAQDCGSDLRSVTPREMLGIFVGLRARHLENINKFPEAESDYLLARYLFPQNRRLYIGLNLISVQCSMERFEPHEIGHPIDVAAWLQDLIRVAPWKRMQKLQRQENHNGHCVDAVIVDVFR